MNLEVLKILPAIVQLFCPLAFPFHCQLQVTKCQCLHLLSLILCLRHQGIPAYVKVYAPEAVRGAATSTMFTCEDTFTFSTQGSLCPENIGNTIHVILFILQVFLLPPLSLQNTNLLFVPMNCIASS
jgi:hypothetical protein